FAVYLSYWFGDQFRDLIEAIETKVDHLRPLLMLTLLAAIAGYLLYHFYRRPVSTGNPEELPIIGHQVAVHMDSKDGTSTHHAPPVSPASVPTQGEAKPSEAAKSP